MQGEYYELGTRLLEVVHEGRGGELDAKCPWHEDNRPSLRFNTRTGLWYCHSCHQGGNADSLSKKLTGEAAARPSFEVAADVLERELEAFDRAQSRARALFAASGEVVSVSYRGKNREISTGKTTTGTTVRSSTTGNSSEIDPIENVNPSLSSQGSFSADQGFFDEENFSPVTIRTRSSHRVRADDIDYAALFGVAVTGQRDLLVEEDVLRRFRNPTTYWTGTGRGERHFDPAWAEVFELGYDPLEDAHTIPIRNEAGQLCGVNFRYRDGLAKYKLPKGFERKRHLYGSWLIGRYRVDDPRTVVVVEGATDAHACWHVGYQGVASYGADISEEQVRILHRMGIQNVILAYDDDEAGREGMRKAWKMMRPFFAGEVRWPLHPRQRHNRDAKGYDPAELFAADADSLARTLDRVRLT